MTSFCTQHFCVSHFGQIVYTRQHVQLFQRVEHTLAVVFPGLADTAFWIVNITENDGIGRTSLLTGSLNIFVLQRAACFFSIKLAFLQTLNTEAAFLHYAT